MAGSYRDLYLVKTREHVTGMHSPGWDLYSIASVPKAHRASWKRGQKGGRGRTRTIAVRK